MTEEERKEWLKCSCSALYFICTYCQIYDAVAREWVSFDLWDAQERTLKTILNNLLVIILKARQLGLTWLVLAYALWLMLFRPAATVLLFSKRDDEAMYLLGEERLKGMYNRLPDFLRANAILVDSGHEFTLSNGSTAKAFPTTAGDSYTATLAVVDEADLVPDLGRLMRAVKPTIDNGGQMLLIGRSDKSKPQSEFKRIYRAAKRKTNDWIPVFLPWHSHPGRDTEWYEAQKRDILSRSGSLDDLHEQYPATDTEALAARTLDKRIAPDWLEACFDERDPLGTVEGAPAIPGLEVYVPPQPGRKYVLGVDPAEGNPTSDDSAIEVLDDATGEQVAALAGKFQPSTLADYADQIGRWYNKARLMVERNNHGHAVLLWLNEHSNLPVLDGHDGKPGWHTTAKGKAMLMDAGADAIRDHDTTIHSFATFIQLASIDGSTLRAPEGEQDDRALAFVLALVGRNQRAPDPAGEQVDVETDVYKSKRKSRLWR